MDVAQLIQAALLVAGPGAVLTLRQLDALIGDREFSVADLETVRLALNESGVEVVDDAETEWPRRPG